MSEPDLPETVPLRLRDLVAGRDELVPLLASAHAFDRLYPFVEAVRGWVSPAEQETTRALVRAIRREAGRTEALADSADVTVGTLDVSREVSGRRPVLGGQQAYIDYTPGVLAKLDALDAMSTADSGCFGWYGLIEYDAFGSDRLISRTELPRAEPLGDRLPCLTLQIHPGAKRRRFRDMRRVPTPGPAWLQRQIEALGAQLAYAGRQLGASARKTAFERLKLLAADYEHARARSRSAADFNVIWSVRRFRRLGFRSPCVRLGEMMRDEGLRPALAAELASFGARTPEIFASIRRTVEQAQGFDLLMTPERAEPFPLRYTASNGRRSALTLETRGTDRWLISADGTGSFEVNLGPATADELEALLRDHADVLCFDVFLPVFLFRLGLAGLINGRGSMRYSLVVGRLLQDLYGHRHPPNLLCAGRSPTASLVGRSPLVDAILRRRSHLPPEVAELESTLISASLAMELEEVRAWVCRTWHRG